MAQRVYLTRRNLNTLLDKLNAVLEGRQSVCTIIKSDIVHPKYPCTDEIIITALEDADYYIDREPGKMVPANELPLNSSQ